MRLQVNRVGTVLAAGAILCATAPLVAAAPATMPALWRNCRHVNARYPRGVGRDGARDKTSGTPVTTFKHSNALYRNAMHYNRGLDRDHDGIACEKL